MAKESFFYPDNYQHLKLLDEAAHRGGVSRGKAFEDFLQMATSALARPRMEQEYLDTVKTYTDGTPGKRGCDSISELFGRVVAAMEDARGETKDVLGDLFQGGITYGEKGQFLTPEPITRLLAQLQISNTDELGDARSSKRVFDPACGSGRMLLAVAESQPHWEFFGQDIDRRCVQMSAINLALRNLYGYVFWGDSLRNEIKLAYRTGFNGVSVIRYARRDELSQLFDADDSVVREPPCQNANKTDKAPAEQTPPETAASTESGNPSRQLRLF
jgi:N-6 DNA methylase